MSRQYQPYGENDPILQIMIEQMRVIFRRTINQSPLDIDATVAMLGVGLGSVLGELQATHTKHAEECEKCAGNLPDYRELFVKNFTTAYSQGRNEVEQEHANAAAEADHMLAKVFKGHAK